VPPIDFVQLAETTGLITELTDQVIAKSAAAVRLLNDIGFRLDVSLNLSTLDLLDEQLAARLSRHLAEQGVPADQITLEITETALLEDGARALETAEALQSLGSNLSIDDFGTGFSSLSYLRMLPASELKIDRSFVTNLLTDHRDEVIVRSTIDLGHNLGLRVAAEGVEDDATRERLRELGCDLAQGFGIARPLPLSRFVAWLTTSGNQVARAGIEGAWRPTSSPLDA
jgi:EAL domain-containing protein (putative c-di-GMP-specific phosphodiesterase class I)